MQLETIKINCDTELGYRIINLCDKTEKDVIFGEESNLEISTNNDSSLISDLVVTEIKKQRRKSGLTIT